jgi:polyisoprenyl-phosphate glycosyltransferase
MKTMESNKIKVSVIVPCYNEVQNIPLIVKELQNFLSAYRYEIILVDDGSTDNSKMVYEPLAITFPEIKFIRFVRNFGHQTALLAGINEASGDTIITIDADLQQPPSLIPNLIDKWKEGFMIVEALPVYTDSIGPFKKYSSHFYYWLLNKLSEYPIVKSANDYRLIDRKVAEVIKKLRENHLYLRGIYAWMGYKKAFVEYSHLKRIHGQTHYPLHKMVKLAVNGITSLSIKPLRLALILRIIVSCFAFIIMGWALYLQFFTDKTIHGWTSTIISTVFLAGIQLIILGIIGEYLGKLFIENKRRPNYIIEEKKV